MTIETLPNGATVETIELAPLAPARTYQRGDLVTVNPAGFAQGAIHGVYKVVKIPTGRGYNYTLESLEGRTGVRAAAWSLTPYEGTEEQARAAAPTIAVCPPVGSVVRFTGTSRHLPVGTLLVVLDRARGDETAAKVAYLGGNEGRYWKAIPAKHLQVLTLAEVAEELVAAL